MGETRDEKLFVDNHVTPNKEVPWLVYSRQPDNARFPHAPHITLAKIACEKCHGDHAATEKLRAYEENRISGYSRDIWGASIARLPVAGRPAMKMSDCETCHAQKRVFTGCMDCHK
jgi:hypothetical protein